MFSITAKAMPGAVVLGLLTLAGLRAQPANDHFADAWMLVGTLASTNGNTSQPANATKDPGEPNHAGFVGGRSVWFNWSAPMSGLTRISTAGSSFNTLLAVYTGATVNALTVVATNDNFAGQGNTSRVEFNAEAGVIYRIALDGRNNSGSGAQSGLYVLSLQMLGSLALSAPPNGSLVLAGTPIPIAAEASTPNPPITRVDFYRGSELFASLTNEPFHVVLPSAPLGTNRLFAVSTDRAGQSVTSAPVNILVLNPGTTILSPASGATLLNRNPIVVSATGLLPAQALARLEFFVDDQKFGEATAVPASAIWSNVTAGVHRLVAIGTTGAGVPYPSATVYVGVARTLVATGSVWRYLDNGSDQGTAWRAPAFDDSGWASGPAQLGYGDGDEATLLSYGPNSNAKFTTTYFRHAVEVESAAASQSALLLRVLRDDGAVVYVNDVEAARFNMPTGTITSATFAATTASDDGTIFFPANLNPALFVEGSNLLAVEIHQADPTSSDISFDLELLSVPAVPVNLPPVVALSVPTNGQFFLAPSFVTLQADAADADGSIARVEFLADGLKIGEASASPYVFDWPNPPVGAHLVNAIATDTNGALTVSASIAIHVFDAAGTPFVRLSLPAADAVYQGPTNLLLVAEVAAPEPLTNVLFLANGLIIGENPSSPFSLVWTNAAYGTNVLAAVARTAAGLSSTSPVVRVTVLTPPDNTTPPVISSTLPPADAIVGALSSIQVSFSERVAGVDAADLLVNGVPATSVSGGGSNYVFVVAQPALGRVTLTWAANSGIADLDSSPLPFDPNGPGASWSYDLRDLAAPTVAARVPPANATVTNLTQVTVTFSEPVAGVEAEDFLVNGRPADSLSSTTNSSYTFMFVQPLPGLVSLSWVTNHGITDMATNAFNSTNAAATWTYTLDTRTILIQSNAHWLFLKGTAEASIPDEAWRDATFNDAGWSNAPAPFFYGDPYDTPSNPGTLLSDMQSNYTSIYLREEFTVLNLSAVTNLLLTAQSDDGFIAWINGVEVNRYNMAPGEADHDAVTLTSITEPNGRGAAYLTYVLPDPATYLVEGRNVIAVHAFNQSLIASSDFGFNAQLYTYLADASIAAPRVWSAQPAPGDVFTLTNLVITFTEPVTGVTAAALLVNGLPATGVINETNLTYTFNFAPPAFGQVLITWDTNVSITDFDSPPKSFDGASPTSVFRYTLVDARRPTIVAQTPPAGAAITNLAEISVTFSKPVTGVDAADLLINGAPATGFTALTDSIYTFAVPPPPFGLVTITWAANHGIHDLETPSHELDATRPGSQWSYSFVDPVPRTFLIAPADQAVFRTPANINFQATATDNDGMIAKVEFFANGVKIGEDTNAPYAFTWRNVPAGILTLQTVATDNTGRSGTSAPVTVTVEQAATALVVSGETWKYLDDGTDQSNAWVQVNFDDAAWAAGPSELGYGDASDGRPEATVVSFGPDPNNKHTTTYFRHWFLATNSDSFTNLVLQVVRDDGAVVYLNGVEAARFNMPTGAVTYATLAATNVVGADEARFFAAPLDPASLVRGTNVLAVEVHQFAINSGSADISFDLQLIANVTPVPPTVTLTSPTNGALVLPFPAIVLQAAAGDSDGEIVRVQFFDETAVVGEATNSPFTAVWLGASLGPHLLRAIATDSTGLLATSPPVSITVTDSLPVVLVRGPYLQIGTPTSGIVRWRTDLPSDARVFYGTNPASLAGFALEASITNEHIVQLAGLQPETRYYYSIGSSTRTLAEGPDYWFETAPAPGTIKPMRVWVLGDPGTANNNQANVRDAFYAFAAATRPADFWLMLGDNAYNSGTDSEYQGAVFNVYPTMLRNKFLWSAIGNHETAQSFTATDFPYLHIFSLPRVGEAGGVPSGTEKYYSFDYANVHFICLDSMTSGRTTNSPMVQWLQNELATTTAEWVIAFFHHPPYTKGNHNSDTETELIEIRQNILPILEAGGVDLVLCGHSHAWERSYLLHGHYGFSDTLTDSMKVDGGDGRAEGTGAYHKNGNGEGTAYVVAGSAGQITGGSLNHPAHYISLNELGSLVMDVVSNRLDVTFLATNGLARDHFTLLKPAPGEGPPAAPTELTARADDGVEFYRSQIFLRWRDRSTNEAGFVIERSTDGNTFSGIASVGPNVTLYVDRGLDSATTYYYRVRSFNAGGSSSRSNMAGDSTHPQSDLVLVGGLATFHAGSEGSPPLHYQWQFIGSPIPGATNEALTISNAQPADEGPYTVVITDAQSQVITQPAWLFVLAPPRILEPPASLTVNLSATADFRVVVEGAQTLLYQWRKNGVPINGATSDTLVLTNVSLADAGDYDVMVANDLGTLTSGAARLTVNQPPLAGPDLVYRLRNDSLTIEVADLLLNDSDPDGEPVSISATSSTTARGGLALLVGRYIFYSPPAGMNDDDTFFYTLADGRGGSSHGVVLVSVADNTPPRMAAIPDLVANVLTPLVFTNIANDAQSGADGLAYSLEAGAPTNARINRKTGVFRWTPTREQAPGTNLITVRVDDDGVPSMAARRNFTVVVNDYVELTAGTALLRAGESGSVALAAFSTTPLSALHVTLQYPPERLTNVVVESLSPELASVSLSPSDADHAVLTVAAVAPHSLLHQQSLARVRFTVPPGQTSAFVPMRLSLVECVRVAPGLSPATPTTDGRVVIVGDQPLLEARLTANRDRQLTLYGPPGASYLTESSAEASPLRGWTPFRTVTLTTSLSAVLTNLPEGMIYYRARE